jgi:hypothetical protein
MENKAKATTITRPRNPRVGRIKKCTGYVFGGALLLGAVIFQAPWKVTLVAAYAFVSSTGLIPRSITKSRWTRLFPVVALLVAWPVWLLLPSDAGDYKPFMFEEEQARFEQEYGVPDGQNAATIYMRLLQETEPSDWRFPPWLEESDKAVLRRPWKGEEHPKMVRWLGERANLVESLRQLSEYSQCRFPTEWVMPDATEERIEAVKAWAHMLAAAANRKAGEGDIAGALQMFTVLAKIAGHHIQQYDVCDYLVGLAIEKMIFDGINAIAVDSTPTPGQLAIMDAMIATPSHEWASTWRRIMKFDCLLTKNTCCRAAYEVNGKGKIRYSRSSFIDHERIKSPYLRSFLGKVVASGMWVVLPKSPWKFARRIDERYRQFARIEQADINAGSPDTKPRSRFRANHEYVLDLLIDIVAPAYDKVRVIHTRSVATWQACRVILLLRQYRDATGHWPGTLGELAGRGDPQLRIDPLNGGPFIYRPEGQIFRLYSSGKNRIDENGDWRSGLGDDWPIWPPRERETEKNRGASASR